MQSVQQLVRIAGRKFSRPLIVTPLNNSWKREEKRNKRFKIEKSVERLERRRGK
jgi:hypothetical protein